MPCLFSYEMYYLCIKIVKLSLMTTAFVSTTQLQRNTRGVLRSPSPFQTILNNNQIEGIVINKETAKFLIDSGYLDQVREELWEIADEETSQLIQRAREGKTDAISWEDFHKKHGI
jgi:hypothetical protein